MTEVVAMQTNPYAGPRALGEEDQIFGRERELDALIDLLIAERIVLLYSPAGAGKTSLIEAKGGLRDRLQRDEGFRVLPPIRVGTSPVACPGWPADANRFLMSAMRSLEHGIAKPTAAPAECASMTFAAYLKKREAALGETEKSTLLIFDQFEEILTIEYLNQTARLEFFQQVGLALRERNRWALFSMREDYFPALDILARAIPTRLNNIFRLHLFPPAFAREAIEGPAKSCAVTFHAEALDKLVHDLSLVWVQDAAGHRVQRAGEEIEPGHLQLVCHRLWEKRASPNEITRSDVKGGRHTASETNAVDLALADYYSERVGAAAGEVKEVVIRQWIEEHLILGAAVRNQVPEGQDKTENLPNEVISQLEAAYLVRREMRQDATWIELAHDRLIKPILENNASWFRRHHSVLQRQADLWKKQGKPDGLCFHDDALADAQAWAAQHEDELRAVDREFLKRCVELRDKAKSERRRLRVIVLTVFLLVAVWLAWRARVEARRANWEATRANREATRANEQERIASSRGIAAQALSHLDQKLDLAMLLAVEAQRRAPTPEARGSLITAAFFNPRLQYILHSHKSVVSAVAFSPDGALLAAGDWARSVYVWDLAERTFVKAVEPFENVIRCVAFSRDGQYCAAGSKDGLLALWSRSGFGDSKIDFGAPKMLPTPRAPVNDSTERDAKGNPVGRDVWAVAFSPDGRWLASSGEDGRVLLWETARPEMPISSVQTLPASWVRALAFLQLDGEIVLVASVNNAKGPQRDRYLWFWKVTERDGTVEFQERPEIWPEPPQDVYCFALSPDGLLAAVNGANGSEVCLRDVRGGREQSFTHDGGRILAMAFDSTSTKLICGSDEGLVTLRDAKTGALLLPPLQGHIGKVYAVAFHPREQLAFSGAMDGKLIAWDMSVAEPAVSIPPPSSAGESSFSFSPDGERKAIGFADGRVIVLPVLGGPIANAPGLRHPSTVAAPQVAAMGWSRDARYLVSVTAAGSVAVLDTSAGGSAKMLEWQIEGLPSAVAVTGNGQLVSVGTAEGTIYLDTVEKAGPPAALPPQHTNSKIWSLEFSRDGSLLLSGAHDETAVLWNVAARKICQKPPDMHAGSVRCAVFSPNDRLLATGSADNTIHIWDTATQGVIGQRLARHKAPVTSLAFSPDSATLASLGDDGQIVIWDVASTQQLGAPLPVSTSNLSQLRFLADPKRALLRLATAAAPAQEWDLTPSALEERCRLRANRNLTKTEWSFFIGDPKLYRPTWSSLPAP